MSEHVFIVLSADPAVQQNIPKKFRDRHHRLFDGAWAVASSRLSTPAAVCEHVGIGSPSGSDPSGKKRWGVVVQLGYYYGHFDTALWQKVRAWQGVEG